MTLWSVLFPTQPRTFPFRRGLRTILRASHVLTTGVLLGGHVFDQPSEVLIMWLGASLISGLLLFATDLHASCAIAFEVRGFAVLIKILLLLLVPILWEFRVPLLVAILFIGVVSSHLPGTYRHRLLFFRDNLVVDERRG